MPWVSELDAQRYVNRTDRTLRTWRKNRWVIAIKRGQCWWYDKDSLRRARGLALEAYVSRRIVPGCGRGRTRMSGVALFDLEGSDVGGYSGSGEADQTDASHHSVLGGTGQGQSQVLTQ